MERATLRRIRPVTWYRRSGRHTINQVSVSPLDEVLFETFVDLTFGDARDAQSSAIALRSLEETSALDREPLPGIYLHIKRAIDVTVAAVGLILLFPLMVIVAAAIALDSAGPILYGDMREGIRGRAFRSWKFRTMLTPDRWRSLSLQASPNFANLSVDPRLTRVGAVLRKLNLDELPQLANVLKGDMSLIGPRPWPALTGRSVGLSVRPGLTGLSQRWGRDQFPPGRDVLELDFIYEERVSFRLDVSILLSFVGLILPLPLMIGAPGSIRPKRESAVREIERRFTTADLAVERHRHSSN